jgi:hypothetical protein
MIGEECISVCWTKSLDHCSTIVALRAQESLKPRLMSHKVLQATVDRGEINWAEKFFADVTLVVPVVGKFEINTWV